MRKPELIDISLSTSESRFLLDTRGVELAQRFQYLKMLENAKLGEIYSGYNDRFIAIKTSVMGAKQIIEKIIGENNG